ncbi:hypothetical protein [Clostridium thermarum]|uniref:hypothetical protein n=1 Tax=Clostridium thermarum TaxID=1716543 RepID=UPI00111EF4C1|nr:hypothetical protein [Clostridium thermarum]
MLSEDLREELEDLCEENDLTIDFNFDHPIRVTIRKSMQVNLLEPIPEAAYLQFKFGIDKIDFDFVGDFRIDEKLFSKFSSKIKKLHYIYLQEQYAQKGNRYKNGVKVIWTTSSGDKVAIVKGWYEG